MPGIIHRRRMMAHWGRTGRGAESRDGKVVILSRLEVDGHMVPDFGPFPPVNSIPRGSTRGSRGRSSHDILFHGRDFQRGWMWLRKGTEWCRTECGAACACRMRIPG